MADNINFQLVFQADRGEDNDEFVLNETFEQLADGSDGGNPLIGSSEEDLTITDVTTPGILILRNLDSTNYIEFGPKDGGVMKLMGRLDPLGMPAVIPLGDSVTIRLKSVAAVGTASVSCRLKWLVRSR